MSNLNNRREFLSNLGIVFGGLAAGAMLAEDGLLQAVESAAPDGSHHHRPRAKSVIWVFLSGGYSHLETFDPKPALNQYAGKTYSQTPFPNPVDSPLQDRKSVV